VIGNVDLVYILVQKLIPLLIGIMEWDLFAGELQQCITRHTTVKIIVRLWNIGAMCSQVTK